VGRYAIYFASCIQRGIDRRPPPELARRVAEVFGM